MNPMRQIFSDPQNLIFSDESDPLAQNLKPKVSDKSNPQKPSFPIRLPTIAKFRLSEDCKPMWGNLDCDGGEVTTKS